MRTRNVYIANLPNLLQDMVKQQFADDRAINVQLNHAISSEQLIGMKNIDLLMLPLEFKDEHTQIVHSFLQHNPCARVVFINPDANMLHVLELKLEHRSLSGLSQDTLRELFYANNELCAPATAAWELN